MNPALFAVKIQALWRGYRSRKGEVLPCCVCGYDMTLPVSKTSTAFPPCSWCQMRRQEEEEEEEPYIPCCMCGANCYGDDYEQYRFCSRYCMVDAGKD